MPKDLMHELEKQKLDLELDRELEATFPASDALKITLRRPNNLKEANSLGKQSNRTTSHKGR